MKNLTSPKVHRLILKRFRSFPAEAVAFNNPTFLVGRNGAGKSNFVDAFAFLAESMVTPLQAVFDRRGGITAVRNRTSGRGYPPNLGMAVELSGLNGTIESSRYAFEVKALPNYGYRVVREQCIVKTVTGKKHWFDRHDEFVSNVQALHPALDASALCLPVIGGDDRFAPVVRALAGMRRYSIEPSKIREMQDPDSGTSLRSDGSNAASVLQELARGESSILNQVCGLLENIVPNTKTVRSKKHGNKLSLEFVQQWADRKSLSFEAFNMSDGTLRALGLLMAVFQRPVPSLVAIEEPESTIHPGAIGAVLDLLRAASLTMQVVVTTHSPELLNAKWINDSNVRVVSWNEGASRVSEVSDPTRNAIRDHLLGVGELLRSNALHPRELFTEDVAQGELFEDVA